MNFIKKLFGSKEKQAPDFPKAPNVPLPMKPLINEKRRGLIGLEFGMYLSWVENTTKESIMGKELERRIRLFLLAEKLDFNEGDVAFVSLMTTGSPIKFMQKTRKDGNLDWRWPKMEKHMGLKKK